MFLLEPVLSLGVLRLLQLVLIELVVAGLNPRADQAVELLAQRFRPAGQDTAEAPNERVHEHVLDEDVIRRPLFRGEDVLQQLLVELLLRWRLLEDALILHDVLISHEAAEERDVQLINIWKVRSNGCFR